MCLVSRGIWLGVFGLGGKLKRGLVFAQSKLGIVGLMGLTDFPATKADTSRGALFLSDFTASRSFCLSTVPGCVCGLFTRVSNLFFFRSLFRDFGSRTLGSFFTSGTLKLAMVAVVTFLVCLRLPRVIARRGAVLMRGVVVDAIVRLVEQMEKSMRHTDRQELQLPFTYIYLIIRSKHRVLAVSASDRRWFLWLSHA